MLLRKRQIKNQLTRLIAGECSPEESRVLMDLTASDEDYKQIYNQLNTIWIQTGIHVQEPEFDVEGAWSKVNSLTSRQPLKVVHKAKSSAGSLRRFSEYAIRVAAILLIGIVVFQLAVPRISQKSVSSGKTVASPLSLADGSTIFLNSTSTIKFPEKFGNKGREVYFWGEAFFEIAPDPARPFIIETGETRIKVLGTSFNVKAYPETDQIEVVVNTGKVLFYHVDKNDRMLGQVTLFKGDKGIYSRKSGQIARLVNDEPNYLSWKTGVLVFSETSLDKVLSAVGQKYGVNFSMDDKALSRLKLTATFDNESLDAVLNVLKLVHNLQFVNNGKDYLVKKNAG